MNHVRRRNRCQGFLDERDRGFRLLEFRDLFLARHRISLRGCSSAARPPAESAAKSRRTPRPRAHSRFLEVDETAPRFTDHAPPVARRRVRARRLDLDTPALAAV